MEKYEVFLFHHFLGIISGTKCAFSDWGWCAFAAWRQIGDDAWVTGSHFSRISCEIPAPWWLGMGVRCCNKKRGECWRSKLKATKWKEVYNCIYIYVHEYIFNLYIYICTTATFFGVCYQNNKSLNHSLHYPSIFEPFRKSSAFHHFHGTIPFSWPISSTDQAARGWTQRHHCRMSISLLMTRTLHPTARLAKNLIRLMVNQNTEPKTRDGKRSQKHGSSSCSTVPSWKNCWGLVV